MAKPEIPTLALGNATHPGTKRIPVLGFGTGTAWASSKPAGQKHLLSDPLIEIGLAALQAGFPHLDTAEQYQTERELGEAIRRSGIAREDLFLTTKVWRNCGDVEKAFTQSLEALGVDKVELYLVHGPYVEEEWGVELESVWRGVERVWESGRAGAIGVSNFKVHHLKQLLSFAKYKPAVNQIEFHPFNQDPELLAFHKEHGILTESYSGLVPLTKFAGVNPRFDGLLEELAQKYNRTKGQILLRWNLQTADVVVTTSNNEKRLPEYLGALEFELQDEDVDRLSKTAEGTVRRAYWTKYLGPNPE